MYTYTWKKYLPVIRLLLKRALVSDQSMTLNRTDFEKTSRVRKPSCNFSIELRSGRLTALSQPIQVKDMLEILMQDDAAKTLIKENHYLISLDTNFLFSIRNGSPAGEDGAEKSDIDTESAAPAPKKAKSAAK